MCLSGVPINSYKWQFAVFKHKSNNGVIRFIG